MSSVDGSGIVPEREADNQRALGSSYLIETVIGRGSTGEVWRARVRETGEPVAAKVLDAALTREPETVARFIRERALLTKVDHPNVVKVRDLVVEGDTLAIITDLVDGPSLRTVLDRNGTLRAGHAVEICSQVLAGLQAVHEQGLIHRDLKPENVLVAEKSDGVAEARIVDFGIAQLAHGDSANERGEIVGTAEYIAPELLEGGTPSAASDVYAVGIILYELVCGRTPFSSDDVITVIRRQLREPAGRPAGIPMELWAALQQLLTKDPDRRPASAADARALLGGTAPAIRSLAPLPVAEEDDPVVIEGDETIITPRRKVQPEAAPAPTVVERSHARRWIAIGVAVALVAGTTAFVALRSQPAAAATLRSAPEFPDVAGKPTVERTLSIDGDDLVIALTIRNVPGNGIELTERIPELVDRRQITMGNKLQTVSADGAFAVSLPAQNESVAHRTYRVPLAPHQRTARFLRSYERKRVALVAGLPSGDRPTTVTDLEVAQGIRLRPGERGWLPAAALDTEGRFTASAAESLGTHWVWNTSDENVAVVEQGKPQTNGSGRSKDTRYFWVKALSPGTATISTTIAGVPHEMTVEVKGPTRRALPCDPSVLPTGRLGQSSLGGGLHNLVGSLVRVEGLGVRRFDSSGGQAPATVRADICPDATPVSLSIADYLRAVSR